MALHERLDSGVTDTLDVDGTGALRHPWVVAGVVLAAALAVVTARAIVTVPRHRRRWVGLGLGIHVAGALGLEAVSGVVLDAAGDGLEYAAVTWAEEGAEMVGALVSRCALLGALDIRVRRARRSGGQARDARGPASRPCVIRASVHRWVDERSLIVVSAPSKCGPPIIGPWQVPTIGPASRSCTTATGCWFAAASSHPRA